jgi:ATP-dependent DNA helicase DinG
MLEDNNSQFKPNDHLINTESWRQFFPFPTIRPEQERTINFALDQFINSNKRFVICEIGTGGGKSAIGVCISRALSSWMPELGDYKRGAYFLTTQKILQEQYLDDFGGHKGPMTSIKSSSNYQCKYHKKQSCGEGQRLLRLEQDKTSKFFRTCSFSCTYKEKKNSFMESQESITNFSYFLAETTYSGKLTPRDVLVVDESHNTDAELSKFIEVSISEKFSQQVLNLKMPSTLNTERAAFDWIKNVYTVKLASHLKHIEDMFEQHAGLREKVKEFDALSRQIEMLDKHMCKVNRFIELFDEDNWVFSITESDEQKVRRLEFKPIDVSQYSEQSLFKFGRKVLMLSATILNHKAFCESLGIPMEEAAFISLPSPFPVENRPVLVSPIGKMSAGEIDKTLPRLVDAIKQILLAHPKEKGIIHCHSYKVANYIMKNVKSKRLLTHGSENREDILNQHISSKEPTVLVSPSMTEGVDLKGDLSRFQILCKVPYPYLGDKLVQKRMRKWSWWYPLQTAKTIIQSLGRSIRSADDHAISYILDADWNRFYGQQTDMFPEAFRVSVQNA